MGVEVNDLEQQIADMQADGRITDDDAEQVRLFMDFLAVVGEPAPRKGEPIGVSPLEKLIAGERKDLIAFAMGIPEDEVDVWVDNLMDERRRARERPNVPMTDMAEIRCQRGCTEHRTRRAIVELFENGPYHDLAPIPEDLWDVFFIEVWDVESQGDGPGYCPAADAVSRNIVEQRVWEPSETVTLLRCFRDLPDAIFVDFGAQLGYYSVLAQRSHLHVVSVEADAVVADLLERNIIEGRRWRPALDVSIWNKRIGIDDFDPPTYGDDLIVKIDIEGAEAQAIDFLKVALDERRVKYMMVELSPMFGHGYEDLVVDLMLRGYRCFGMPPKAIPPHPLDDIRRDLLPWEIHGSERDVRMQIGNVPQQNVLFVHESMEWPMFPRLQPANTSEEG